jgi:hypothetical protein
MINKIFSNHFRARLKPGRELFTGPPLKSPEIGNFYFKKILISNLVSKVLY